MTATTLLRIDDPLIVQNGGTPGNLGIVNRCLSGGVTPHAIRITITAPEGAETVMLVSDGDSMGIDTGEFGSCIIESDDGAYPIFILYLNSTLDLTLAAAPVIGNTITNPVPVTVV